MLDHKPTSNFFSYYLEYQSLTFMKMNYSSCVVMACLPYSLIAGVAKA